MLKGWCILIFCLGFEAMTWAQVSRDSVRLDSLRVRLERLVVADPVYLSEVEISAGSLSLDELLRRVAQVNEVNLCVKIERNPSVTCHLKRVKIVDLLFYLCREYELELEITGNIVSVLSVVPEPPVPREFPLWFDSGRKEISYDLRNEQLVEVVKKITALTGERITVPQPLYQQQISGFASGLPVEKAILTLASSNELEAEHAKDGVWTLHSFQNEKKNIFRPRPSFGLDEIKVDSVGQIYISVQHGNIQDIIVEVCRLLGVSRMFLAPMERHVSLYVSRIGLPALLDILFTGTPFSYKKEKGLYIFGIAEHRNALTVAEVIPMRYRTVADVAELIPDVLKNAVQVRSFPDQNSVIVAGNSGEVGLVRKFLESIDLNVPLITIEVMIVDSRKSALQEIGLTAGLGDKPVQTGGSLSPGVQMSLSATSVNRLIHSFNGFGAVNLGKVTPNFYLTLKAMEEAGTIELRSTPKLSTLNGHEALLKSGETRYYKEVQNNIMGTQNPIQSESYTWKSVEANMSLKITPFVCQNGKITLSVEIEQNEFTAREEKDAPPGVATRSFKSQIRVDNEDVVLLGGIDRNTREKNSRGLPFIARIPVLKWLFGSLTNNRVDEKLSVFIKSTVIF